MGCTPEPTAQDWFRFLRRKGIKRAVRIKKDFRVDRLHASEWFADLQMDAFWELMERTAVYGEIMRVVATSSPMGDLVIIATNFSVWATFALDRPRCRYGMYRQQPQVQRFRPRIDGYYTCRAA